MTTVPHDHVHALGQSALVMAHCEIGLVYRLPKYLRHLRQTFAGKKGLRVLELGSAISLITAAGTLALSFVPAIRRGARLAAPQSGGPDGLPVVPHWEWAALGIVGIAALAARLVPSSLAPPAVPADPAISSTVSRVSIQVGNHIRLIGYELIPPAVRTGEPLTVTLYWQTDGLLMNSYKSFVHVPDVNGLLTAQSDAVPRDWTARRASDCPMNGQGTRTYWRYRQAHQGL